MILVVGATGQLGTAIVRKLADRGQPVRALARRTSNYQALDRDGVELVFGDLLDEGSLVAACTNVDTVIATANAAVPTQKRDSFKSVDGLGYVNLIRAAKGSGVRQIIYTSALSQPGFDNLPIGRQKHDTEQKLRESGLIHTIFRADAFMDVYFAMMGSDLPVRGAESATVERSFWFTSRFFNGVKDSMTKNGTVGIMGDGNTRHSFVCIDDLAEFHVRAVRHPAAENKIYDIGGPEALTQNEVLAVFEKILGRSLKPKRTPAVIFKVGYNLLRFFSPAAANIMGLNYYSATNSSVVDMTSTADLFNVRLTSVEEFLREKAGIRTES
ncbi:MAG: SDR family oxidoreductase [Acidobacteriota bacterium]